MKNSKSCLLFALSLPLIGCSDEESHWDKNLTPRDPITLSVADGAALTEPLSATATEHIKIYLSEPSQHDFTVHYSTLDGTASSELSYADHHYFSANRSVEVNVGDEFILLPIEVRNNQLHENDVNFELSLTTDNLSYVPPKTSQLIQIKNSDPVPSINFDLNSLFTKAKEGDSGLSYQLTLNHRTTNRLEITIVPSGTAKLNEDYSLLTPLPLVIEPKRLTSAIELDIHTDTKLEYSELAAFTVESTDMYQPGDRGKLSILIAGDTSQNDTGLTTYYDGSTFKATQPSSDYPGQDASVGRDTETTNHIDGHAGYSFLKHNYAGEPIDYDDYQQEYACAQDQVTGLYIETKGGYRAPLQDSGVVVDKNIKKYKDDKDSEEGATYPDEYKYQSANWNSITNVYTWYEPDSSLNNNVPGAQGHQFTHIDFPVSTFCSFPDIEMTNYDPNSTHCNSSTYIAKLNANGVCGFKDWRLPTPTELRSFLVMNTQDNPVAVDYFAPYKQLIDNSTRFEERLVWTNASAINTPASAWCIDIKTAKAHLCNKNTFNTTIAVRGGVEQ